MLSRNDYAKKFELVVKQEVKNHNDQMLATNISINNLKLSVDNVRDNIDSHKAKYYSEISLLKADVEKLKAISQQNQVNDKGLKDLLDNSLAKLNEEIKNLQKAGSFLASKMDDINAHIIKIENHHIESKENIKNLIHSNSLQNHRDMLDLKNILTFDIKELSNANSPSDQMKEEILSKVDIFKVDNDGLMKEIQVLKNQKFVLEKNVENLYTQIERLKIRIDECHKSV